MPPARNPVAFAVVELLANNNELNPSAISRAVGRSVQRVSTVLGALRLAEVVRYDSDGKRNRYRLKHPREVRSVLASLSRFVKVASVNGRARPLAAVHFHVSGIPETWKLSDRIRNVTLCV
jgi:DNA-binding transcriptional ArsR family regulator